MQNIAPQTVDSDNNSLEQQPNSIDSLGAICRNKGEALRDHIEMFNRAQMKKKMKTYLFRKALLFRES